MTRSTAFVVSCDELMRIAVDVDERIFRPVRRCLARERGTIGLAFQVAVEPLDLLVAAVRIRDRIDQHHEICPNPLDHRLLGYRQPIGQLQHRLRGARLIRMQRRIEVIERAAAFNQACG